MPASSPQPPSPPAGGLPTALLAHCVEQSPSPGLWLDAEGTVLFANAAAGRWLETPPQACVGRALVDFVALDLTSREPSAGARPWPHALALATAGRDTGCLLATPRGVGAALVLSVRRLRLANADSGSVEEIVCAAALPLDAQRELRRSEALFEGAPVAVQLSDASGRLLQVNDAWQQLLGYAAHEVIGRPVEALLEPDSRASWQDEVVAALHERADATVREVALRFVSREGRPVEVRFSARHSADEAAEVVAFLVDMTEHQRVADALRSARDEAEAASRARSAFLANMSHELRTPLNGILGYAQLLERQAGLGSEQRRGVEAIRRSGEHLLTLINDVLDRAQIKGPGENRRAAGAVPPRVVESPLPRTRQRSALRSGYLGRRRRVLVVDDRPENRAVLVDVLATLGFEVLEAADGMAALAAVEASAPELVLMDLIMPVMDGFEATRRIRALPGAAQRGTRIVALSASVFEADRRESLRVGCDAFVAKPVDVEVLLDAVGELLELEWSASGGPCASPGGASGGGGAASALEEVPPREALEALYEASSEGRIVEVRRALHALEEALERGEAPATWQPFVRLLCEYARTFRLAEMCEVIDARCARAQSDIQCTKAPTGNGRAPHDAECPDKTR